MNEVTSVCRVTYILCIFIAKYLLVEFTEDPHYFSDYLFQRINMKEAISELCSQPIITDKIFKLCSTENSPGVEEWKMCLYQPNCKKKMYFVEKHQLEVDYFVFGHPLVNPAFSFTSLILGQDLVSFWKMLRNNENKQRCPNI